MKRKALTLSVALLFSVLFVSSVKAENWSAPTPILFMENTVTSLSMSADGSKIAFSSYSNGNREIFVVNWDGTGLKQLTNDPRQNVWPSISGDGSKITYTSFIGTMHGSVEHQEDFRVFVVNSDGTGLKQISGDKSSSYSSIADDGCKIAFLEYHEVCVINSDGTGLETLTDKALLLGDVPLISGDGTKVIFIGYVNRNYELFVVNSDGTNLTRITDGTGDGNGCGPSISGDGKTIVFRGGTYNNGILLLAFYSGSTELWTIPTPILTIEYTISRICVTDNGSRIFFTTRDDYGNWDTKSDRVFTVTSDGTGLTEILSGPAGSFSSLAINGDGSKIAFIDYPNNGIFVSVDLDTGLDAPVPADVPDVSVKELSFDVTFNETTYIVETVSNSSVCCLSFNEALKRLRFSVYGTSGTAGFCNVSVPAELMSGEFSLYIDDVLLVEDVDYSEIYNGTHYTFSIGYEHSSHVVDIISTIVGPDFSTPTPTPEPTSTSALILTPTQTPEPPSEEGFNLILQYAVAGIGAIAAIGVVVFLLRRK